MCSIRRTASVAAPRCPAAKRFGGERQQSVELLHEPGKHPADVGSDFGRAASAKTMNRLLINVPSCPNYFADVHKEAVRNQQDSIHQLLARCNPVLGEGTTLANHLGLYCP